MNGISIVIGAHRPYLLLEETLADVFRATVLLHASKTALIFGSQSLTYAELDAWSDVVALSLTEQGIVRGVPVGVWWPRGLELHVIILGIIKSGAAYVPLDYETPADRVVTVLTEVKAVACFSKNNFSAICPLLPLLPKPDVNKKQLFTASPKPDDWAYVLYTSGSTGKPKGIPITHRQICHLIRAEQTILDIYAEDKVYQGFAVSFDMWCEETWLSYLAGATLWIADASTAKAVDELSVALRKNNITVLHAVPSLLGVMDDDIPSLRLINAGGEACTVQVLERWAIPSRKFFNSYGPTETTVTATITELKKGDPINIGKPLPNYNLAVIDESLNVLPCGSAGELVITGPGVSQGYVNLPQLTSEKFILKPYALNALPGTHVYRTGDAAVINNDGSIELKGRLDDQIKLRGYRIELGEIEVQLSNITGVAAAAVTVKKDNNNQEHLIGYIVPQQKIELDEAFIRTELSKVLPGYMVPGSILQLIALPRQPSGKVDRKALPLPEKLTAASSAAIDAKATVKQSMLALLNNIFPNHAIDLKKDFFTDLGGHSLLAAVFVSRLRKEAAMPRVAVKDIYLHRPLEKLCVAWENINSKQSEPKEPYSKVPLLRFINCWLMQTMALFFIYALFATQLFFPYLGYYYIQQETESYPYAILTALALFCFIPLFLLTLNVILKWLIIGKMRAGTYPLWGSYYFRWWFVKTLQRLMPIQVLNGTPLYPIYLRLMGVKVAADAQLSQFTIGAEDLITIGKNVSISSYALLNNAIVENGLLKLSYINLENNAYIGSNTVISGNTRIESWGEIEDLSYLPPSNIIPFAEIWQGSPAKFKAKKAVKDFVQPLAVSKKVRQLYNTIYLLFFIVFPFTIILPLLPTIIILNELDNAAGYYDFSYIVITPLLALSYLLLFAFGAILTTRLLQHKIKPGVYPVYSLFYVRKWFSDQLMSLSLLVLHPIFATVYISAFFKALGAKVGKQTEISTANGVTHPLLEIGEGAFIADAVTLGEVDIRGQQLFLKHTSIGNNSFVGNSASIPQGYELPDNMLIGVLSTVPDEKKYTTDATKDWFGSPAIPLPNREASCTFDAGLITTPSFTRKLARGTVELIRILIPQTTILSLSILFIAYAHDLLVELPLWEIMLQFPFYYLSIIGIPAFLITVVLKWLFVGRYKPMQAPMWTWEVWRSEAVTTTYEALSLPFLLEYLKGTPWLPICLRLFGVKTGKRVWMNTGDITEFDMVTIGDDAALNEGSGPQTHLFEDRVMKVDAIKIGERVTVGARSIVLYGSNIGDDVHLQPLSLVMKGEKLSDNTVWEGSPIKPA